MFRLLRLVVFVAVAFLAGIVYERSHGNDRVATCLAAGGTIGLQQKCIK